MLNNRLRENAAAAYCGLAAVTLRKFRVLGTGPVFARLGKAIVYDVRDIDAWLDARKVTIPADARVAA